MKEPEQQEEAWRTFGERTFQEEYEKEDNGTILPMGRKPLDRAGPGIVFV